MPHRSLKMFSLTVGLAAALFGATVGHAQVKIVMSNDNNALGVKGQTFELLKSEIQKRLGSKVKVELYHSGTLFDQQTQIQGLELGSADIIAPTSGIYASVAPKVNVLALPFLLSTPKAVDAAMSDSVVRNAIFTDLEKKNIEPVAIWINGPRDFSYRGAKPILVPADMRGVKMRVQAVPVDIKTMQAFGANVVTMSWTEVPTALQQGVIDAVEPTPNALVGAGLQEMVTQMTRIGYEYSFYIVGANKKWWDGLSLDVRSAIQEALKVATQWNWENTGKENQAAYAKLLSLGKKIHDIDEQKRAQWVKAVQPVWQEFGDKLVGHEVMARLREIGEKNR